MKDAMIKLFTSFINEDTICKLIGYVLGKLLAWARSKDCWDKLKSIISTIRGWIDAIDEVIEDDELSEEEESKIVEVLKSTKIFNKVEDIIKV